MAMFESLAAAISEEFSGNVFAFIREYMVGRRKSREIKRLLDEYRFKCAYVNTQIDLANLLGNTHICDELIAHCYRGDLTKQQAIAIFLSNDLISPPDSAAVDFIGEIHDGICSIIGNIGTGNVGVLMAGINRVNANDNEIIRRLGALETRVSEQGQDGIIAVEYLEMKMGEIESKSLDPVETAERVALNNKGIIGNYLSAYVAFCREEDPCIEFCSSLEGNDELLSRLACVALSSGNLDSVVSILSFSTEDTSAISEAVSCLQRKEPSLGRLAETGIDSSSKYVDLVLLINAEAAYSAKCLYWANEHFTVIRHYLNPLSKAHARISQAWVDAAYASRSIDRKKAEELITAVPKWASQSLVADFGLVSELIIESLAPDVGMAIAQIADERLASILVEP